MKTLNRERKIILLLTLVLTLFGLLMIYESSSIYAWKLTGDSAHFFKRQLVYFLFSIFLFFFVLVPDVNFFKKHSHTIILINIILLILVLFVGKKSGGARRWLGFMGLHFQPTEFLKISFLIYCAHYFERKGALLRNFKEGLFPLIVITAVIISLIVLEPDLGSALFWMIWLFLMLFILKSRKRHLFLMCLAGIVICGALVTFYPYRFSRIAAYFNPWQDARGSGFQLIQSQIAYGAGGIGGLGLGESRQKFLFLPAAHTDFIFSIIAEEFGLVGSVVVLVLLFFIFYKMFTIAYRISNPFRRIVCLGGTFIFGLEVIINVGVSCGLFPTKGLPLPFISYGGSNLVVHYILLGLFFNASRDEKSSVSYG